MHLSTLPVDCRVGKLILLGAMFGVADEALTMAAIMSLRSPFMSPPQRREEADRAKHTFATEQSDHLTVLRAYNEVDAMGNDRFNFCREYFLGIKTIQTIALLAHLLEKGNAGPFLVVAPLSAYPHWQRECERWAPSLRTVAYVGVQADRARLREAC